MLKPFILDSIKYVLVKGVVALAWLISLKVFTSALSPEQYGSYSIFTTVLTYGLVGSTAWLIGPIIRFYPETTRTPGQVEEAAARLMLISALGLAIPFTAALIWTARSLGLPLSGGMIAVIVATFILNTYLSCIYGYLRARRDVTRYAWVYSFQTGLGVLLSVWLLLGFGGGLTGIFAGQLVSIALAIAVLREWRLVSFSFQILPLMKEMARYGLPILFINALSQMLSSADQLILKFYGRDAEVGIYAANYMLAQNSIFAFTSVVSASLGPVLFHGWERGNRRDTMRFLWRTVGLISAITLPFTLLMCVFNDEIAGYVIDPKYAAGAAVIPWVSAGAFFVGVGNVFSEMMTLRKKTASLMGCYAIAAACNVALNFAFIPKYGMKSAAIATFVSYLVLFVAILLLFRANYSEAAAS